MPHKKLRNGNLIVVSKPPKGSHSRGLCRKPWWWQTMRLSSGSVWQCAGCGQRWTLNGRHWLI